MPNKRIKGGRTSSILPITSGFVDYGTIFWDYCSLLDRMSQKLFDFPRFAVAVNDTFAPLGVSKKAASAPVKNHLV
jgi:hypothetical protein